MPTYDYRCTACGARFEAWQKFTDEPIRVCPTCSGPAQRVIHAPAITFKGSGFYITDSKGSRAVPSGASDGDGDSAAAKTNEAPKAASESGASAPASAEPAKAAPPPPAKAS
ncbi:MAG TPA: FmdB family zinc ribbon protein [Ktedonobacterales bacterium]|nr:FmdB family zinc ribbon protein [Ktedonobacterales bacterium]